MAEWDKDPNFHENQLKLEASHQSVWKSPRSPFNTIPVFFFWFGFAFGGGLCIVFNLKKKASNLEVNDLKSSRLKPPV